MSTACLSRQTSNFNVSLSSPELVLANRYRIDNKVLGTGTWAQVRLGTDLDTKRSVAVKIIPKCRLTDYERSLVDQEIEAMRILDHPNVVKLYHAEEDRDNIYIVLEHVPGGDLLQFLAEQAGQSRVPEKVARKFFVQLVRAVEYLHSNGIAHRDLKLENLLLDRARERLVVIDFGLCGSMSHRPMTVYCGSPAYAAPELIQRIPYSGRAVDVWAMGVILFAVLVGDYPFAGDDIDTLYRQILHKQPAFPATVSSEARNLVLQMLAKRPADRITLAEIKRHPWLTGRIDKDKSGLLGHFQRALDICSLANRKFSNSA